MRLTTMVGFTASVALTVLAFGCSGADQTNSTQSNTGGGPATGGSGAGGDNTGAGNTGGSATGGTSAGGASTGGSNTGGSNTGGSNTGGSNTGGSNTGGSNTGGSGMCTPITEDASKIGTTCNADGSGCPTGYTCQPFAGIVITYTCAILCEDDCECPAGGACLPKSDKSNFWNECSKP